ncbi:hypothetical protein HK099_006554 [Clydaea vesicula]|uniref:Ribosome biogenesis regulatory protein n=1 Tax=Clydaea vesicula TaxID=447962 RepID=A0AAD5XU95_9FUNG|nr:hypothetical protein HK099_006554 [Clydaea vesicula]
MNDWLIELPDNMDPNTDVRSLAKEEKKGRIEKNLKQQKKNLEKSLPNNISKKTADVKKASDMIKVLSKPLESQTKRKEELNESIKNSKISTASMGKFDLKLKNEPEFKRGERGEKRKFAATTGNSKEEKHRTTDIVNKVLKSSGQEPMLVDSKLLKKVDKGKVVGEIKEKNKKRSEPKKKRVRV